jgi:hypothetical protein
LRHRCLGAQRCCAHSGRCSMTGYVRHPSDAPGSMHTDDYTSRSNRTSIWPAFRVRRAIYTPSKAALLRVGRLDINVVMTGDSGKYPGDELCRVWQGDANHGHLACCHHIWTISFH